MTLPSAFSDLSLPFFLFSSFPFPLSVGEVGVVDWLASLLDAADFPSSSFFLVLESSELFSGREEEEEEEEREREREKVRESE